MNKTLILFASGCYILQYSESHSQNLIPNPGFEIHDTCPNTTAQMQYCIGWENVEQTTDYFNSCAPLTIIGVPENYFGYQPAHSGCGYCGMYTYVYDGISFNIREYMQAKLDSTLKVGVKYYISFYINLMNGFGWSTGINKFGFRLTTYQYVLGPLGSIYPDNYATFNTDSIVIDTVNWTKISGSFIADSAYSYITFGNFFDDAHTQYIILAGAPNIYSYYYLDDVCLSSDSLTCISVTQACYTPTSINENKREGLIIYPNPFNDYLTFDLKEKKDLEIFIYDLTSRLILRKQFNSKITLNTKEFNPGIYFYEVRCNEKIVNKGKVIKE